MWTWLAGAGGTAIVCSAALALTLQVPVAIPYVIAGCAVIIPIGAIVGDNSCKNNCSESCGQGS